MATMNVSATTSLALGTARPGLAILWGGLICGTMDITAAITVYGQFGLKPVPLLQGIAAGLLGPRAMQGGAATAAARFNLPLRRRVPRRRNFRRRGSLLVLPGGPFHLRRNFVRPYRLLLHAARRAAAIQRASSSIFGEDDGNRFDHSRHLRRSTHHNRRESVFEGMMNRPFRARTSQWGPRTACFILLVIMVIAPVAIQANTQSQKENDLDVCKDSRDPQRSIAACSSIIAASKKSDVQVAEIFMHRGSAYFYQGDYDRAIADYDSALQLRPDFSKVFDGRGLAYERKGDHDRAFQDFDQAIRLDPNFSEAYHHRGRAHQGKNEFVQALQDFDQAIRLDPNSANPYYYRGEIYQQQGDSTRALQDFNRAIELNPNFTAALVRRGLLRLKNRDYDQAIPDFERTIRLEPNSAPAFYDRGLAYEGKRDYRRAIPDFDAALRIQPGEPDALYARGLAFSYTGNYVQALWDYNHSLAANPNNVEALNSRGVEFAREGKYELAIKDYDEAIRLDPHYNRAFHNRSIAYAHTGQFFRSVDDAFRYQWLRYGILGVAIRAGLLLVVIFLWLRFRLAQTKSSSASSPATSS
jgi:tetratricopeptide (TPR) repeat protein